jgi:wyosine [tRNA(Phe)-imidazoG37] synthetase (radical SAM superfamily)
LRRDKEDRATDHLRYVFGPVASGRLGLSLGLDGLGGRICSFDCLYCEAGATEALTAVRKPYVPVARLLAELAAWKKASRIDPDVVTLGGLGEPTLNTDCGPILAGARELFPGVPTAVLTNSSLLSDPEVRSALDAADIVLPSMDTLVATEFFHLNRPHPDLALGAIRQGLLDFRAGYAGRIFLEILLVAGVNDTEENLALLRDFCRELSPDRVDVTTMSRPGAHAGAGPVSGAVLGRFREALGASRSGPAESGHGPSAQVCAEASAGLAATIAASVRRRPQTVAGLAQALGLPECRVAKTLEALLRARAVRRQDLGHDIFYSG